MSKAEYKRLGDYIRPIDVRNRELKVTNLLGVSISKEFMPSIANTIGTDMSVYKIVERGQFAYGPVTSRNGDKVSIALLNDYDNAIISQAYTVFEVIDHNALSPEYLMMWFKRPEFDRYARFHSHGSAREIFDWNELSDVLLPVPSIEEQRRIVSEYQTVEQRIQNNKQLIKKLEDTAQAIYNHTFVEGIDEENLPKGWRTGILSDIADIVMGQSPDGETYNLDGEGMIFYQGRTDFGWRFPTVRMFTTAPTRYAKEGDILMSVRAPVGDLNICVEDCCIGRGLAAICEKQHNNSFLYYLLLSKKDVFKQSDAEGTIFGSINKDALYKLPIIIPDVQSVMQFNANVKKIDDYIMLLSRELNHLYSLLSLLNSKLS